MPAVRRIEIAPNLMLSMGADCLLITVFGLCIVSGSQFEVNHYIIITAIHKANVI